MVVNRTKIIDRTIPEVICSKGKFFGPDISNLIQLIHTLGADIIEINHLVLKNAGSLPSGPAYLYRIDSVSALEGLSLYPFEKIVIDGEQSHFNGILKDLSSRLLDVTVEFRVERAVDIHILKMMRDAYWMRNIRTIRIIGLNRFTSVSQSGVISEIKRATGVDMDICPENQYYNATAVALDGFMNAADYITTSFMGYGGSFGYAALEQVLTFARVILGRAERARLNILPMMAELFTKAAGVKIPENMPVIGENIFAYESGIHADGINKNPMTYEPFDPGLVGQERQLHIGKHSGKQSVARKLQGLGIEVEHYCLSDLLKLIRDKSISLHRSLEDNEIIDLLKLK